jgi:hypothetical protein
MAGYLLLRALALAGANLTVNEWLNRHRYVYLQHEGGGFCNRFDRGVAANCCHFWAAPALQDWWAEWDAAEQVRGPRAELSLLCNLRGACIAVLPPPPPTHTHTSSSQRASSCRPAR